METLSSKKKAGNFQKKKDGVRSASPRVAKTAKSEPFTESSAESRETSSCASSSFDSTEEAKAKKSSSASPLGWPIRKATISKCTKSDDKENKPISHEDSSKFSRIGSKMSG